MTIALDPGAFALRSLRRRGRELVARRCRTIAVTVADNQARRRWLERSNLPHLLAEEFLVLPGDAAIEAEGLFGAVPRDLLPGGELPKSDPVTATAAGRGAFARHVATLQEIIAASGGGG